jgi:multidrug resistance efflux pump
MSRIKLLYIVWFCCVVALVMVSRDNGTDGATFFGIAETREIVVNAEKAVEVRKVHVVPGQLIHTGQLLVALDRPELTHRIIEISNQIDKLKAQQPVGAADVQARINELEAQQKATGADLEYRIAQLNNKQQINKGLTANLRSIQQDPDAKPPNGMKSPLQAQAESLKKELELGKHLTQLKINTLKETLNSSRAAGSIQLKGLDEERNLLQAEKKDLLKHSPIMGVIGSINFKEGEQVSPFDPILTVHSRSPAYVEGYIHENVYSRISVKDKVRVVSMANKGAATIGEVVGVGARIVEYPLRLRKRPDIQMWGREVQILIPPENRFLLGEKLIITPVSLQDRRTGFGILESLSSIGQANHGETEEGKAPERND